MATATELLTLEQELAQAQAGLQALTDRIADGDSDVTQEQFAAAESALRFARIKVDNQAAAASRASHAIQQEQIAALRRDLPTSMDAAKLTRLEDNVAKAVDAYLQEAARLRGTFSDHFNTLTAAMGASGLPSGVSVSSMAITDGTSSYPQPNPAAALQQIIRDQWAKHLRRETSPL